MEAEDITIRMAKNDEGDVIGDLVLRGCGFGAFDGWDIDWSDIEPYWFVAEAAGVPLGCVQVCPGKPIGRVEMLSVEPALTKREAGLVTKVLIGQAIMTARLYGGQGLSGVIFDENADFKQVAEHRGWFDGGGGHLYYKRIV